VTGSGSIFVSETDRTSSCCRPLTVYDFSADRAKICFRFVALTHRRQNYTFDNNKKEMLSDIFTPVIDIILDAVFFWDNSDTRRVSDIKNARDKVLSGNDDVLIDSNKSYLLLNTKQGLYLVSRKDTWKAKLGDQEEATYASKGKRSFARIRRSLK